MNPPVAEGSQPGPAKFDLDREVRDDSFSAGEKQMLALCRALVKSESRVLGESVFLRCEVAAEATFSSR